MVADRLSADAFNFKTEVILIWHVIQVLFADSAAEKA